MHGVHIDKTCSYRIAGNFRGVLIFVIFVTYVAVTKFCTPRKFAIVGKGRQTKSRRECAHDRNRTHGSIIYIRQLFSVNSVFDY